MVKTFECDLPPKYVVISDCGKGLLSAVELKLVGARYTMYCQQIAENINETYGKDYRAIF